MEATADRVSRGEGESPEATAERNAWPEQATARAGREIPINDVVYVAVEDTDARSRTGIGMTLGAVLVTALVYGVWLVGTVAGK